MIYNVKILDSPPSSPYLKMNEKQQDDHLVVTENVNDYFFSSVSELNWNILIILQKVMRYTWTLNT